ncbi:MAG: shikimate dehydrogenase [Planctomycetaceae bacterium]|jgi:3-dehydroquinate dehydratase/shikimate dehydrogenase|nr:shikimate dehydrogenase [Planctomycetaceae bacterium]
MLCVTVARTRHKHTIQEHLDVAAQGAKLVELRMDYIARSVELARVLKNRPTPVVVTCRRKEDGGRWEKSEEDRLLLLRQSIATGVEYIDLEEDTAAKIPRYGKTKRIISYHNFEGVPENLEEIHARLAKLDADIVKIAVQANSFADTLRVIELMRNAKVPTIGIAMGDYGSMTRILAMRYGAPFTYCVFNLDRRVAPGQLSFNDMKNIYRVETITAKTKIFGVVADPVAHSYSPMLHNSAFQANDLDYRYLPFRVAAQDIEPFVRWAQREGIGGLSVTIPHKQSVLPLLTQGESAAQGIGACNTIVFNGEDRIGYNTDYRAAMECIGYGLAKMHEEPNPFEGRSALLLGSGGVARAIGWGLAQRRVRVAVTSRNFESADKLAKELGGRAVAWDDRHSVQPNILINGTPIGMFPEMDATPFRKDNLDQRTLVFDTVYNPEQTLLIRQAKAAGCPVVTGLSMFVRQAAYQYRLFTGLEPPIEAMTKALRRAISPLNYNNIEQDDDEDTQSPDEDD